jgi:fumarylacetoacetase
MLNETHDPQRRSWVSTANAAHADFPIQNLPFGVFRRAGSGEPWRGGVAIGDQIVDLAAALQSQALSPGAAPLTASGPGGPAASAVPATLLAAALAAAAEGSLNRFMAAGPAAWSALRLALSRALALGSAHQPALAACLVPLAEAQLSLPASIGDFTDFYSSIHHAMRVGELFRPERPLLPNYQWIPIGYHGRSSSIIVSGQPVRRPLGQQLSTGAPPPCLAPSQRLDYELELGAFIGPGNALGERIALDTAEAHVFGLCLLNDWSARDLQSWEAQPLGPFLSKSFATTVSPWIVTLEALAPFRLPWSRPADHPQPLPYLDSPALRRAGAFDIHLEAWLQSAAMRRAGQGPERLSVSNSGDGYWSLAQLVAHHSVNGCNLRPGDLLATGTLSGPLPGQAGCLLELTHAGRQPLTLADGEVRAWLQDGDTVILRGWCERAGAARIGFGEASAQVLPAQP